MANVVLKTEEEQRPQVTSPTSPLPPVFAEAVEASVLAPVAAVATIMPLAASSARRYDQATIEKALALAIEMQQRHQATLTAEQIVSLGEEINVDQAFVLKALAQLDATADTTMAPVGASAASVSSGPVLRTQERISELRPLSLAAKYAAVSIPLLFAFLSFFVFVNPSSGLDSFNSNSLSMVLMFGGSPLLALLMGWKLRSKRLALVSGFCVGFFFFLSAVAATRPMRMADFFLLVSYFAAAGAMISLIAALCQQYGPRVYRRLVVALFRRLSPASAHDAQK